MDSDELIAGIRNANLHVAGRLASARKVSSNSSLEVFHEVLTLATMTELPGELSRELGRTVARLAAKLDKGPYVETTWLSNFTSEAYEAYDVEMAIARWDGEHGFNQRDDSAE